MKTFKMLLLGTACAMTFPRPNYSQQPPRSKLLRGQYQNKIRRFSPPQKIFDVFATKYIDGRLYMTKKDLINAICFYNYCNADDERIKNYQPTNIIKFLNRNDNFQIYDYFILSRMLSYDYRSFKNYCETNKIKKFTKQQYHNFILTQVCGDYDKQIKQGLIGQSRKFKPKTIDYKERVNDIIENIFKDNKTFISLDEIIQQRIKMMKQIFRFEAMKFQLNENNLIDGEDFARSIVKYVETNKKKQYTKRIKQLQQIHKIHISQQTYVAFHLFLQNNLHVLEEQLQKRGALTSSEIQALFNKIIQLYKIDEKINSDAIKVMTLLLDTDNSGFIQKRQLLGILQKLQYYTMNKKCGQQNFITLAIKDWYKMQQKMKKIVKILNE